MRSGEELGKTGLYQHKSKLEEGGAPKSIGYWALYMQRLRSWRLRHGARCAPAV